MCDSVFQDVSTFLSAVGHVNINEEQQELYWQLVEEELQELRHARHVADRIEELDAIADLIWVLIGYAQSRGYSMPCAWEEVRRSNLGKIHPDGTVHRREDGKILKPADWSAPDLRGCV